MPAERARAPRRGGKRRPDGRGFDGRGPCAESAQGLRLGGSIAELQRSRSLTAAVGLLADEGYESFSVGGVCERAGISRRTFYELFDDRQACLVAILTDAEARLESLVTDLELDGLAWSERVRMGLWVILCFAESDPALAKVCVIESQRGGSLVQRERRRLVDRLIAAVDDGRLPQAGAQVAGELTAEALVGAVIAVLAARLASATAGALGMRGLLSELMGMMVLPYQGPKAAMREIKRALPLAPVAIAAEARGVDPLAVRAIRLTYRTARVLQAVAQLTETGAGASNRQVAEHAGISDQGQASKLLGRLQQHGLLQNTAEGNLPRGEANDWRLTATGGQLLRSITVWSDAAGQKQQKRTMRRG